MLPLPVGGHISSALIVLLLPSLFGFLTTATSDLCPHISNTACRCHSSSSPSSPQPDISCTFNTTQPPSPIFNNMSTTTISVQTLDLSHNALRTLPPDFFQGIHSIHRLDLGSNQFTQIPHPLSTLARLAILDLSNNLLTSVSLSRAAAIPGLERLNLARNKLTVLRNDPSDNDPSDNDPSDNDKERSKEIQFQSLQKLNMSGNAIESINSNIFRPMQHLVELDLSHNRLPGVTDMMFSQLQFSLNSLNLSHNLVQSIQPMSLHHLQHLRVLNLAHNHLGNVSEVLFPTHLRSLDLSHCTLTIINHCQLTALPDLSFIGLQGNELRCTCQLYLLLQWYQDQHHKAGISEDSNAGSNWTCTCTSPPTTTPHSESDQVITPPHVSAPTDEDPENSQVQYVRDLRWCQDTASHCQTLEHRQHHPQGTTQMVVTLDVALSDNTLMASWTFQDTSQEPADGFQLHYMPEDSQPIDSPIIGIDVRSYVLRPLELEKHFKVCLDVLAYQTTVVHQQCRDFKDESQNIIVGILAGTVFLMPGLVVLVYIMIKDKMIRKKWQLHNATDPEKVRFASNPYVQMVSESSPQTEDVMTRVDEKEEQPSTNQITVGVTLSNNGREKHHVKPDSPQSLDPPSEHGEPASGKEGQSVKDAPVTLTKDSTFPDDPSPTLGTKQDNPSVLTVVHQAGDRQPQNKLNPQHQPAELLAAEGATVSEMPVHCMPTVSQGAMTVKGQAEAPSSTLGEQQSHSPSFTCGADNPAFILDGVYDNESTDF